MKIFENKRNGKRKKLLFEFYLFRLRKQKNKRKTGKKLGTANFRKIKVTKNKKKQWENGKKRKLYKERIKTFIPYLTSFSDCAIIQYTLERFRLEPNAINWLTEHPSGIGGLLGIWPVQCAIANISGASLTSIFPLGDAFPGSYKFK